MRALVILIALFCGVAHASPAEELGAAYRAYDANDLETARTTLAKLDAQKLGPVRDYVDWLRGMVALRTGDPATAQAAFERLDGSRFAAEARWRLADVAWAKSDRASAAAAYAKLIVADKAAQLGDVGTAKFRIAETKSGKAAIEAYRAVALDHPSHPLAERALARLADLGAAKLTHADRLERAKRLSDAHLWDEAISEFSLLPEKLPKDLALQRDYWMATTLFKMRRRYGEAGLKLLDVYQNMGGSAAEAMFHGARALSRADKDDEAIRWYHKVVAQYPSTAWAQEAQYLAGWLELNRGNYKQAIGPLEDSLQRYPKSKWVDDALWSLGMAHYFLGEWDKSRVRLEALAKRGGSLEGGKGMYWLARIAQRLDKKDDAIAGYKATITRYPFSWYALLSHTRLAGLGIELPPFGVADPKPRGPKLAATVDESLASDALIERADVLIAAGLVVDAGSELARGEVGFLKRHDRGKAFAMLLDRYRKAGNFNRPWMLAVSYSGNALNGPPADDAKRWWENAYPRAYRELIEKHQALGKNPDGYLYSIMRKESGFNAHVLSYADAQGLLQMIPATTRRVAKELGVPYDAGRLYEPEYNIQTGSWYIGHMLQKFKGQVPLGAGSYNSGPRPVMRWIDQYGDREIDELVELVPYTQTREYMKKVTENYARYRYLYANEVYKQPLIVDKQYLDDRLTY
ncbi:MAG: transglycosylase SLT domain-containing protein [Deltaproteobacteria bacterium]|nr:transglycosylase SLT domain-containing protein [Deltaproteobacteria bacterium]